MEVEVTKNYFEFNLTKTNREMERMIAKGTERQK